MLLIIYINVYEYTALKIVFAEMVIYVSRETIGKCLTVFIETMTIRIYWILGFTGLRKYEIKATPSPN